jgi:hypothetical protein
VSFSVAPEAAGGYRVAHTATGSLLITPDGTEILPLDDLARSRPSDVANALAATALVLDVSVDSSGALDASRRTLAGFSGLAHRMQPVAERDGVRWIDDPGDQRACDDAAVRDSSVVLAGGGTRPRLGSAVLASGLRGGAIGEAAPESRGPRYDRRDRSLTAEAVRGAHREAATPCCSARGASFDWHHTQREATTSRGSVLVGVDDDLNHRTNDAGDVSLLLGVIAARGDRCRDGAVRLLGPVADQLRSACSSSVSWSGRCSGSWRSQSSCASTTTAGSPRSDRCSQRRCCWSRPRAGMVYVGGSRRWLGIGAWRFQLSELAKPAASVVHLLTPGGGALGHATRLLPLPLVLLGIGALVCLEPDLDSTVLLALIVGSVMVAADQRATADRGTGVVAARPAVAAPYRRAGLHLPGPRPTPEHRVPDRAVLIASVVVGSGVGSVPGARSGCSSRTHTDFIFADRQEPGLVGTFGARTVRRARVPRTANAPPTASACSS